MAYVIQRRRVRFRTDVGYARRQKALKEARRQLAESEKAFHRQEAEAFYAGLSKTLRRYATDKLNLPPGADAVQIIRQLEARGVRASDLDSAKDCFERFEMAQFSAVRGNPKDLETLLHRVKELIGALEKQL